MAGEARAAGGIRLNGAQKAAILFIVLGEEAAAAMLPHLSKREVARVAREVAEMKSLEEGVGERVMREFYQRALSSPAERGGPEFARKLLSQASIPDKLMDQLLGPELSPAEEMLGPLLETQPPVLAAALQDEHPQTTALVLLHLPPARAAETLRSLPETAQAETILRMATLRQVKGEMLGEVADSLHERLNAHKSQREETDGIERTATVLTRLPRGDMKELLDSLNGSHPEQAAELRNRIFTFDSLMQVDDAGLQELLRQVDNQMLALALQGADEKLAERILNNLSKRASDMLREEMEFLTNVKPAEQQAARKEVLDTVLKLEAEGNLQFMDPPDEED